MQIWDIFSHSSTSFHAQVNWHLDIINCLLDNGADVNRLNNEGVSSLAACHVFFYPIESFHYNIAEHYLDKPPELVEDETSDANETMKGILSNPERKKASPEKKQSQVEIQKVPEEHNADCKGEKPVTKALVGSVAEIAGEHQSESEWKLGTLQVKRSVRISIDEVMAPTKKAEWAKELNGSDRGSETTADEEDFESNMSIQNYPIDVTDQMIERCATQLSQNSLVTDRARSAKADGQSLGTVRQLAIGKSQ